MGAIPLLDTIRQPSDIRGLSSTELAELATEMRTRIFDAVSKNGGHLASNLGVVELTVAIHAIFDTPRDRLLWDVGHQAYPHKILTGRRDQLASPDLAERVTKVVRWESSMAATKAVLTAVLRADGFAPRRVSVTLEPLKMRNVGILCMC